MGKMNEALPQTKYVRLTSKLRVYIKRMTSKYRRRLEKRDPENAPVRRPTQGWAD